MFKNLSIGKKIGLGFGILIFLIILLSFYIFLNLSEIEKHMRKLYNNFYKLEAVQNIRTLVSDVTVRELLMMLRVEDLQKRKELYKKIQGVEGIYKKNLEFLKKATVSKEEAKKLNEFIDAILNLKEKNNKVIELALKGRTSEANLIYDKEVLPKINAIDKKVSELLNYHQKRLKDEIGDVKESVHSSVIVLLLLGIISVIISFFVCINVINGIKTPVRKISENLKKVKGGDFTIKFDVARKDEMGIIAQSIRDTIENVKGLLREIKEVSIALASSAEEMNAISKEFSVNIDTTTEKTTQIASAAEEMSVTVVDIAKNTQNILNSSVETAKVAREGEKLTLKTAQEVKVIEEAGKKLQDIMFKLVNETEKIQEVVTFIKEVAEQTNLLALNATIEAARAGEHGKSFAVVAGEIRKLAERTNKSTEEVDQMIKEIQNVVEEVKNAVKDINEKVNLGVKLSEEASNILNTIAEKADKLQEMIQTIASATEEMSVTADSVAKDVGSIAEGTKDIKVGIEQLVETSKEVAKLGNDLKNAIEKFKV